MPIIVTLDVMLARRKMRAKDLAQRIDMSETNLSLLRSGKVKGVRFETMERLCRELDCRPGDLLDFEPD
jgi:putative transcriptional regulator